jgi:predicted hotdog family 3-hydroxylacyl-ACP dehydratase
MLLDRAWIERHIPHHGRMCLLDEVLSWDTDRIVCRSGSHRAQDNPLRSHGRLGVACGIEYAAQTMAVHGALSGGAQGGGAADGGADAAPPTVGMLAGLRGVEFRAQRLDDLADDLVCSAIRVAGDPRTALYEFELACAGIWVMRGRATVLLEAGERMHP